MLADHTIVTRPPHVVEIVGPAAAGKTTLIQTLCQRSNRIRAGVHLRRIEHIPFLVSTTLLLSPTWVQRYRSSRWFTREEMRAMVYLKTWHRVLGRPASNHDTLTVLDHGPIFKLVLLREFGPEITKSQVYEQWWNGALDQWAGTLDMVIWLDAPDEILMQRIQSRDRWHRAKEQPEQEIYRFLARYRASYEQVFSMLMAHGGPQVIRFDTYQESLDQTAEKVLAVFDLEADKR